MEHPKRNLAEVDRRRCQSLNSLYCEDNALDLTVNKLGRCGHLHRTCSDSSVEMCLTSDNEEGHMDSGISERAFDGDMLMVLEHKIERLSDMFLEQCRLLTTMKEEIRNSKAMIEKTESAHNQMLVDMLKKALAQRVNELGAAELSGAASGSTSGSANSRAENLLSAIEARKEVSLDNEIRSNLANFLQSEEFKGQMVRATAESVRGLIGETFTRDISTLYLPVLERAHRRLVAHIDTIIGQAFNELEDKSSSLFKSVHRTSGALRRAMERHQCLLEATANPGKNLANTLQCTIEELLQNELKEWREKVTVILSTQLEGRASVWTEALPEPLTPVPSLDSAPISPAQPADPKVSVIDQLMQTALINKQIQEGDVNGSFERALSAADLSLVMAACRAANPGQVFAPPCCLKQPVLLSLIQQLATDMVHETHLKCRYIEEAIINLDVHNQDTRAHLPLVVGEVRKHLSNFLTAYPNHSAGRRITLIVMAANNLLK